MGDLIKYEILPEDYFNFDLTFKILFVGDVVGKTQILNRAIKGNYEEIFMATVGFEFYQFYINLENKAIKLSIWDTSGQENYRSLYTNYYVNANLIVIVYSIAFESSFINVSRFLNEAKKHCPKDCKFFLVGNMLDLESERRVTRQEGEQFAQENSFDFFDECSAKLGINTQNILIQAGKILSSPFNPILQEKIKIEEKGKRNTKNNYKLIKYISY